MPQAPLVRPLDSGGVFPNRRPDRSTHDPNLLENADIILDEAANAPQVFPNDNSVNFQSRYNEGFHSFSGAETRVTASINGISIPLNDITTLSYSVYRDKYEVKTLGNSNVRGRTRGSRTVAGTIIFIHTAEHPLLKLMNSKAVRTTFSGSYYSDEIIPMDLTMTFIQQTTENNQAANLVSRITLRGVEFTTEAATWSIHQPMTELTVQYVALSVEPMVSSDRVAPGQALDRVTPAEQARLQQAGSEDFEAQQRAIRRRAVADEARRRGIRYEHPSPTAQNTQRASGLDDLQQKIDNEFVDQHGDFRRE